MDKTRTSSYVAIAPFPIFRGGAGECPDAHLSRFAKVCRANDVSSVDSMMKIFPVTLLDEALLWYDLNIEPCGEQLSWEDIKSSFSQAYGSTDPPETIRSELGAIRQGQKEFVRSYFLRLQYLLQKLPEHGLSDGDLNQIFARGLRVDIRDRVVAVQPGCLKEALRVAFGSEKERKRTSAGGNVTGAAPEAVQRSVSSSSKSQCQCSKHQCWRKNLEKNLSDVGGSFKG